MSDEDEVWYVDYLDYATELSAAEQYAVDCATECICGAWSWGSNGKPVHIADCICGAD